MQEVQAANDFVDQFPFEDEVINGILNALTTKLAKDIVAEKKRLQQRAALLEAEQQKIKDKTRNRDSLGSGQVTKESHMNSNINDVQA